MHLLQLKSLVMYSRAPSWVKIFVNDPRTVSQCSISKLTDDTVWGGETDTLDGCAGLPEGSGQTRELGCQGSGEVR